MSSLAPFSQASVPGTIEDRAARVKAQLGSRFRGVQVQVGHDGVVLRGRVSSYYAKQVVQHLVMRLTELPILANEIEVG